MSAIEMYETLVNGNISDFKAEYNKLSAVSVALFFNIIATNYGNDAVMDLINRISKWY